MKLTRKTFESLEAEKLRAEKIAFAAETAITALQAICEHDWQISPAHGYPVDDVWCRICRLDAMDITVAEAPVAEALEATEALNKAVAAITAFAAIKEEEKTE